MYCRKIKNNTCKINSHFTAARESQNEEKTKMIEKVWMTEEIKRV